MYGETTKLYDIPLNHLDYKYITDCCKLKELETILKVLRSGTEGRFPDLERHCENKIHSLDADNRLIRKPGKLISIYQLSDDEQEEIESDFQEWVDTTKAQASFYSGDVVWDENGDLSGLPRVRQWGSIDLETGKGTRVKASKHNARKPRTYEEWAKIDKELEEELQADEKRDDAMKGQPPSGDAKESLPAESSAVEPTSHGIREKLKTMPTPVRRIHAQREKEKGNEALIACDYNEALGYYNRSLLYESTPAVFNNRALLYLKQKKWRLAVEDCNRVLVGEPENIKALLRRSQALFELHSLERAQQDLQAVLFLEPENTKAMTLLKKVKEDRASREKSKLEGGRRMVIEETDSDPEDDEVGDASADHSGDAGVVEKQQHWAIRDDIPEDRGVVIEEVFCDLTPLAPKKVSTENSIKSKSAAIQSQKEAKQSKPLTRQDYPPSEMPAPEEAGKSADKSPATTEKCLQKRIDLIQRLRNSGIAKLHSSIGIKLDAEELEEYIFSLHLVCMPQKDFEFIYDVLEVVSNSPRFQVACLLLDESASTALRQIFDELHNSNISATRNVVQLQTKFCS